MARGGNAGKAQRIFRVCGAGRIFAGEAEILRPITGVTGRAMP
jgi:hypothetical protein